MPTDTEVEVTRVVDAPRHLVFQAWTDPKHVSKWLLGPDGWTMPVCEIDARAGGLWHFVWRRADGTEMSMHGSYREVTPPERLVTIEKWGAEWPETVNTLTLAEHDGQTTMTMRILYASKAVRDAAIKTGMKDGMERSYSRLDEYLRASR